MAGCPKRKRHRFQLDLVGGLNPSQKHARQIGWFPQGSGWKQKKCLSYHHLENPRDTNTLRHLVLSILGCVQAQKSTNHTSLGFFPWLWTKSCNRGSPNSHLQSPTKSDKTFIFYRFITFSNATPAWPYYFSDGKPYFLWDKTKPGFASIFSESQWNPQGSCRLENRGNSYGWIS